MYHRRALGSVPGVEPRRAIDSLNALMAIAVSHPSQHYVRSQKPEPRVLGVKGDQPQAQGFIVATRLEPV